MLSHSVPISTKTGKSSRLNHPIKTYARSDVQVVQASVPALLSICVNPDYLIFIITASGRCRPPKSVPFDRSVYVNEMQGNPFQPDVNYRGYTASPLLGTPQGLSVFMDGVRMNQAFGDVVSWDLIPKIAIKSVTLVPGSNPLFGLNTLGGALSIDASLNKMLRYAG